jgi:adenylate cyclase
VLNPNFAVAFGHQAAILAWLNRPEEAIRAAEKAMRLSPHDPVAFAFYLAMALAHLAADRYEAAWPWAERALHENGGVPALRFMLCLCGHLGRRKEAETYLRRLREIHPELTIATVKGALAKGTSPEVAARGMEGLRKAGLPEQ